MRSVIDTLDLSVEELYKLIDRALDIISHPRRYSRKCKGKKLASLFFEPSTRTRLSFEAAMLELGGSVISVPGGDLSSQAKGESVADTAKVVSSYADIIAMRHPKEGSALVAASNADIPLINAGDGGHCHPTQTLADLLTIFREKGTFDNIVVGLCGDLKYGRTVHSLIGALSRYSGIKFVLISPKELRLPDYVKEDIIKKNNLEYVETSSLDNAIGELDVLYMTRIQRERFQDMQTYDRLKDSYILTPEKLARAKDNCSVLHPLPRVNEISVKIDEDLRACYFKQVSNGKYMRMALILMLLDDAKQDRENHTKVLGEVMNYQCENPHCIITTEQELENKFIPALEGKFKCKCSYCETKI